MAELPTGLGEWQKGELADELEALRDAIGEFLDAMAASTSHDDS